MRSAFIEVRAIRKARNARRRKSEHPENQFHESVVYRLGPAETLSKTGWLVHTMHGFVRDEVGGEAKS
jgi:hypothetical protein